MRPRVFIDTNVFIFAFEFPKSNSRKIIDMLNAGLIEPVVSERVVKEIITYFKRHYKRALANDFRNYLLQSCEVVFPEDLKREMKEYKEKIKEKDLEQIAVVKYLGLRYLVSFDRDFTDFEEYTTPKQFLKIMGLRTKKTDY
ncbi:MAG: PIN domain-containing protein [Thermoplasmata archaeon]|nr:MAG: PIN domain-containing protein [Thermoplasmata archaeon]